MWQQPEQKTREISMLKALIILLMLAVIVSLFSGLFFLIKDGGKTNRVVNSLAVRVTLSVLLLVVIILSIWQGSLTLHPTP
jgi:branched-subunit amino acid transport protein AzlD